jgi:two-component system NtrC family sensor kinase
MAPPDPAARPTVPESSGEASHPILPDGVQQDKLSLIGHMASSVAHELSNPLATIVASAQAILAFWPRTGAAWGTPRDSTAPRPEFSTHGVPLRQLREDLELILAEARRAGDLVHGLLASARQDPPEWRICAVADVVRRTVILSRHHLKLHNITLQAPYFDPEDGYPLWCRVRGDANQLQQVLLNLLINAQQAITAHRGYGTVRVTLAPDGADRVVLTVEDDGPGVDPENAERIFQPFFTTKPKGQGTGLGLSICRGIVEAHGGSITAQPHPRGGAVFRVVVPSLAATDRLTADSQAPRESGPEPLCLEPPTQRTATAAPRILLVDDEAGIRRSVGRFLRGCGYQVTDVGSVAGALNAIAAESYDAIISDLRLPGMSGEQFHRQLSLTHPDLCHRVLFTSGDLSGAETRRFLETSGCPSLQKPYELAELVRLLADLCPPALSRASA